MMSTDELLQRDNATQGLIPAYSTEVDVFYEHIARERMIDKAGFNPSQESNDFVFTRQKLAHNGIRGLYSKFRNSKFRQGKFAKSEFGKWLSGRIFGDGLLSSAGFSFVIKVLVVVFFLFMVLAPAGCIYLLELSKSTSYGLVVGFVLVFSPAFAAAVTTFEHLLLGLCAYAALLTAMLFQAQVGAGPSCS